MQKKIEDKCIQIISILFIFEVYSGHKSFLGL